MIRRNAWSAPVRNHDWIAARHRPRLIHGHRPTGRDAGDAASDHAR